MSFGLVLIFQITLKKKKKKRECIQSVKTCIYKRQKVNVWVGRVARRPRGAASATRSSAEVEAATLQTDDGPSEWSWWWRLAPVQILEPML